MRYFVIAENNTPVTPNIGDFFDKATPLFHDLFNSRLINFGYWNEKTSTIAEAQKNLVKELGVFAKLGPDSKILDVGCGTGEQDLLWLQWFNPTLIQAINLSKYQIHLARKLTNRSNQQDKIKFDVADACHIPNYQISFNHVLGLECAHLFLNIKSFFESASKSLTQAGSICLANLSYKNLNAFNQNLLNGLPHLLKECGVGHYSDHYKMILTDENQNATLLDQMTDIATHCGFVLVEKIDITKNVAPFYQHFLSRIKEFLLTHSSSEEQSLIVALLVFSYLRDQQFSNNSLGYYFLKFALK